jgi:hypothetical protein
MPTLGDLSNLYASGANMLNNFTGAANNADPNQGRGQANQGVAAGRAAGRGLNSDSVQDLAMQNGNQINLNSQDELDRARRTNKGAALDQFVDFARTAGLTSQLGNQASNLNTERDMAKMAQANAATNVGNQLSALSNARRDNASLIQGVMQGVGGMYR